MLEGKGGRMICVGWDGKGDLDRLGFSIVVFSTRRPGAKGSAYKWGFQGARGALGDPEDPWGEGPVPVHLLFQGVLHGSF